LTLFKEYEMKTTELTGPALDWAVAICEDLHTGFPGYWSNSVIEAVENETDNPFAYSTDWSQGGLIIEREKIATTCRNLVGVSIWKASISWLGPHTRYEGPTPLIAAMRCYVASKLGNEVEVPDELV
jgi:hypothetical protein